MILDGLPMLAAGTGGKVDRYHAQTAKIDTQITPFGINIGVAHALDNIVGLVPAVNPDSAVTFFFGTMKITVIAIR